RAVPPHPPGPPFGSRSGLRQSRPPQLPNYVISFRLLRSEKLYQKLAVTKVTVRDWEQQPFRTRPSDASPIEPPIEAHDLAGSSPRDAQTQFRPGPLPLTQHLRLVTDREGEVVSDKDDDTIMLPDNTARTNVEFARLVPSWRERLNPLEIPGLVPAGSHHRMSHVSQEDTARPIGLSKVRHGTPERGEPAHSADFLDRTASALRPNGDERVMLHLYALGHEPAPRSRPSRAAITESLRQVLAKQAWPTYLSDEAWDIVAYNREAKEWFPWLGSERNMMRWVFTYPEARQQLHDWHTAWAPSMLAQLRAAQARNPRNERLAA